MSQRLDYAAAAPDGYKALGRVHQYILDCGLEPELVHLVYLRISQINGCAYCVDLHYRDAIVAGMDPRKINSVVSWREAPFFSDREAAALGWAESLTKVAETGAPDADFEPARAQFDDKDLADLTYAIGVMNAFNRLGVGFRNAPAVDEADHATA